MRYRVKINRYLEFYFWEKGEALDFMEQAVMAYMPKDSEELMVSMDIVFPKEGKRDE